MTTQNDLNVNKYQVSSRGHSLPTERWLKGSRIQKKIHSCNLFQSKIYHFSHTLLRHIQSTSFSVQNGLNFNFKLVDKTSPGQSRHPIFLDQNWSKSTPFSPAQTCFSLKERGGAWRGRGITCEVLLIEDQTKKTKTFFDNSMLFPVKCLEQFSYHIINSYKQV